jgi:SAM-dependent methyltransferase
MAAKFNAIGPRINDIEKAFSYITKPNPNVLEIGCGNGRDAGEIIKRTEHYLGIDFSSSMIDLARQQVPLGKFEVSDVEDFVFPTGLDIIFSFASLLHSPKDKVKHILKKAYDALNKDGIFYISSKFDKYHALKQTDEFGTRTYYFYTTELIEELAGPSWHAIFSKVDELRGQKWFVIILKKV